MIADNNYSKMQEHLYNVLASDWSLENRDPVVGSFDAHNNWQDYEDYLWKDIEDLKSKKVIDFGCGPGRNLVKWASYVGKIDGVDISSINLDKAKVWIEANGLNPADFDLFKGEGTGIASVPSDSYDVVMSTIAMQHICVHDIRVNLLKEFHRVLKDGGKITIQMGFGPNHPRSVDYYENYYDANTSNGGMDTRIEDPNQLKDDLEKIGFKNFNFYIRPVGPGDSHNNWIFFNAEK
jgi:ubiquinone/menaquinone biosynthesis C-methylase UbiE